MLKSHIRSALLSIATGAARQRQHTTYRNIKMYILIYRDMIYAVYKFFMS